MCGHLFHLFHILLYVWGWILLELESQVAVSAGTCLRVLCKSSAGKLLTAEPFLQPLSMGLKSDSTASLLSLEGRDHCSSFVLGGI